MPFDRPFGCRAEVALSSSRPGGNSCQKSSFSCTLSLSLSIGSCSSRVRYRSARDHDWQLLHSNSAAVSRLRALAHHPAGSIFSLSEYEVSDDQMYLHPDISVSPLRAPCYACSLNDSSLHSSARKRGVKLYRSTNPIQLVRVHPTSCCGDDHFKVE